MKIWQIVILIMVILRIILFGIYYRNIKKYFTYNYMTKAAEYYKRRYDIISAFYMIFLFMEIRLLIDIIEILNKLLTKIYWSIESIVKFISNKTYDLLFKKYEPEYEEQDYEQ